jgi:exosortase/archaeosortase family protein
MISMSIGCLGFQLMLLFAVMVLFTGTNRKARWIYIILGIFFLNFINILRFVLLFIHLQKHGDYLLTIEAHNLYNFITYVVVFLFWVLWFEKFADTRKTKV